MGPMDVTADIYTAAVVLSNIPVAVCVAPAGDRLYTAARTMGHKLGDEVLVVTIDPDDQPTLARGLDVAPATPTLLVINHGYIVARTTDIKGAKHMCEYVNQALEDSGGSEGDTKRGLRRRKRAAKRAAKLNDHRQNR